MGGGASSRSRRTNRCASCPSPRRSAQTMISGPSGDRPCQAASADGACVTRAPP
jgi:hypothetical protein